MYIAGAPLLLQHVRVSIYLYQSCCGFAY